MEEEGHGGFCVSFFFSVRAVLLRVQHSASPCNTQHKSRCVHVLLSVGSAGGARGGVPYDTAQCVSRALYVQCAETDVRDDTGQEAETEDVFMFIRRCSSLSGGRRAVGQRVQCGIVLCRGKGRRRVHRQGDK